MKQLLKNVIKSHEAFEGHLNKLNEAIKNKIDFDGFVMYQPSDGFVLVHTDNCHNAPIDDCLNVIELKGILSYEDYLYRCI